MEQFPALRKRLGGAGRDRVGADGAKTRTGGGKTFAGGRAAPLKPKAGLNGAPGPAGHVSVNAPAQDIKNAIVVKGKLPNQ